MRTITKTVTTSVEVNVITIGEFFDWLDTQGVIFNYLNNVKPWLHECTVEKMISGAFSWSETEEGTSYWGDICDKWRKYIEVNNIEEIIYNGQYN